MDLVSGCPFWIINNGILGVYPALREHAECEVAIIGGGISGALIGYRLAEAGIDAVMLDKRDIGTGSTAASTSLLQYETDLTLTELKRRFGQLFPKVRCDVAFSWTGTFAETKDSLPYIGEAPGRPGIYFALGYGGNGVIFSALAAEIIRDEIVGEKSETAELFRFGR